MARFAVSTEAFTTVLVVCMLVSSAHVDASITYAEVATLLTACISYAIFGGTVPQACCEGVKAVHAGSTTVEDHRAICGCIMDGISRIPGINYDLVGTLHVPTKSHLPLTVQSQNVLTSCDGLS
ncbi:hypothetical protein ACB092_08G086700 [Castanea dentata]